jgi:hypothetical protein
LNRLKLFSREEESVVRSQGGEEGCFNFEVSRGEESVVRSQEVQGWFNFEVSRGGESVVRSQEVEGLNRLELLSREEVSVVPSQGGEMGWFYVRKKPFAQGLWFLHGGLNPQGTRQSCREAGLVEK